MSTNGKKWMKRLNVVIMKRYIFYGILVMTMIILWIVGALKKKKEIRPIHPPAPNLWEKVSKKGIKRYLWEKVSKVKGVDFGVGGGGHCWGASPYTTLLKTSRGPKEIRKASHQGPRSGEFSLRNTFSNQLKHQFRKGASFVCFLMETQK